MNVGPHPHIGLCTLTYLFEDNTSSTTTSSVSGVLHRDSTGAEQAILPNQVNWMCSGKGVTHSERPLPTTTDGDGQMSPLHGLQLWVALPRDQEDVDPSFHHSPSVVNIPTGDKEIAAQLVVGNAFGSKQEQIPLAPGLEDMFLVVLKFGSRSTTGLDEKDVEGRHTAPNTSRAA